MGYNLPAVNPAFPYPPAAIPQELPQSMKVLSAARLAALFRPARRRGAGGSAWLPLALLLAALATAFLFGNDRGSFYRMSSTML